MFRMSLVIQWNYLFTVFESTKPSGVTRSIWLSDAALMAVHDFVCICNGEVKSQLPSCYNTETSIGDVEIHKWFRLQHFRSLIPIYHKHYLVLKHMHLVWLYFLSLHQISSNSACDVIFILVQLFHPGAIFIFHQSSIRIAVVVSIALNSLGMISTAEVKSL